MYIYLYVVKTEGDSVGIISDFNIIFACDGSSK